jgi:hypothetical protein
VKKLSILHVVGARPNFMKIAPVLEACARRPRLASTLVHTGQHYDEKMSQLFFEELGIPRPDVDLEVGSGSQASQTALILQRIEPLLLERRPDLVLVVGDVNSTVACGLAAVKLGIPVAPRRGGPPQLRPVHARGDQPHRHRRDLRAALRHRAERRGQPRTRGRSPVEGASRRERDDRHLGQAPGVRVAKRRLEPALAFESRLRRADAAPSRQRRRQGDLRAPPRADRRAVA